MVNFPLFALRRALTVVAALVPCGIVLAAEPVYPPGSRIGLVPPADMVPTPAIAGFRNPRTGAAIVTMEMPAQAYPSIAASLSDETLRSQGFTVTGREDTTIGATATGMIVLGDQRDGGHVVRKALLVAADAAMTGLVIAQTSPDATEGDEQELLKALKTVAFRPPLSMADQLSALPFAIGDLGGFRPVRVMAGNSILLTDGPNDVTGTAEQPIMIVAESLLPAPAANERDAFARALLTGNTVLKDTVIEQSRPFRQAGTDWHEIVARGKEGSSDTAVTVLQTIRFDPDRYVRIVGIVRSPDRDAILPRFRKVVDSVAPR